MNRDRLVEIIQKLKNETSYYKNKPHFVDLLEKITKKSNIIENLLTDYENSITDKDYSSEIKILENYIKKYEKKYIEKVETSDCLMYLYETEWKIYPNRKSTHLHTFFKDRFKTENFDEIIIDNIKRNETSFTQNILIDIRHSKSCVIILKIRK